MQGDSVVTDDDVKLIKEAAAILVRCLRATVYRSPQKPPLTKRPPTVAMSTEPRGRAGNRPPVYD